MNCHVQAGQTQHKKREKKKEKKSWGSKRMTTKQNAYLNILTLVLKCTTLSPFETKLFKTKNTI